MRNKFTLLFILFASIFYGQNKTPNHIDIKCDSNIVFDTLHLKNKVFKYKVINLEFPRKKTDGVADILLPDCTRKNETELLEVLNILRKKYKFRFVEAYKNCETIKIYYSPYKPTAEQDKYIEENFLGTYEMNTQKKIIKI